MGSPPSTFSHVSITTRSSDSTKNRTFTYQKKTLRSNLISHVIKSPIQDSRKLTVLPFKSEIFFYTGTTSTPLFLVQETAYFTCPNACKSNLKQIVSFCNPAGLRTLLGRSRKLLNPTSKFLSVAIIANVCTSY